MRIVHIITRMIVGGAQENTRYNCLDLFRNFGDDVTLVTGPSVGAEGSLLDKHQDPDLKVIELPELIRSIRPVVDYQAHRKLKKLLSELSPDVVHTHSAKAGILGRSAAWQLVCPTGEIQGVQSTSKHPNIMQQLEHKVQTDIRSDTVDCCTAPAGQSSCQVAG